VNVTKESLDEMYSGDFFKGGEYVDYLKEEPALRRSFKRNLKLISNFCPSGRLLEIGCAYGFFLDVAKRQYEAQGIFSPISKRRPIRIMKTPRRMRSFPITLISKSKCQTIFRHLLFVGLKFGLDWDFGF
jgi:hypothetical protein